MLMNILSEEARVKPCLGQNVHNANGWDGEELDSFLTSSSPLDNWLSYRLDVHVGTR